MSEENIIITEDTTTPATPANQPRYKSWALWVSVLGAVGVILNAFGVFELIGIDNATFEAVVNAVGTILIAFGIVNNPTSKTHF